MSQNFWYWLVVNFLENLIRWYLPYFPRHQYWGLPATVVMYGGEIATILFVFLGQFVGLANLARVLAIILLLEIWRNKGKILKVFTLLRFLV